MVKSKNILFKILTLKFEVWEVFHCHICYFDALKWFKLNTWNRRVIKTWTIENFIDFMAGAVDNFLFADDALSFCSTFK